MWRCARVIPAGFGKACLCNRCTSPTRKNKPSANDSATYAKLPLQSSLSLSATPTNCKCCGDEFCKRCNCRKHLRWSYEGKQYRQSAGTRSWAEAEDKKREIEDQLLGRMPEVKPEQENRGIQACIDVFFQDKKNQGITEKVVGKYTRELARLKVFCEGRHV